MKATENPVLPPDPDLPGQHTLFNPRGRVLTADWDSTNRVWFVDYNYGTGETPLTLAVLGFRYNAPHQDQGADE